MVCWISLKLHLTGRWQISQSHNRCCWLLPSVTAKVLKHNKLVVSFCKQNKLAVHLRCQEIPQQHSAEWPGQQRGTEHRSLHLSNRECHLRHLAHRPQTFQPHPLLLHLGRGGERDGENGRVEGAEGKVWTAGEEGGGTGGGEDGCGERAEGICHQESGESTSGHANSLQRLMQIAVLIHSQVLTTAHLQDRLFQKSA